MAVDIVHICTWFDEPLLLGILYHALANPVLDTAARLLDLQLAGNPCTCSLANNIEKHHRGVAYQVCHAVGNLGTLGRW